MMRSPLNSKAASHVDTIRCALLLLASQREASDFKNEGRNDQSNMSGSH
jgi:hypothetical protein